MKHEFTLLYQLPDDWLNIDPCLMVLAEAGLRGGAVVDCTLTLWFMREAESRADAIEGAMLAVVDVMPEAKFVKRKE